MTIQILSLVIALLAVIVGPIVTYKITKDNLEFQFRTLTLSNWLSKLEDAVLTFLTITEQWIGKYRYLVESAEQDPSKADENNKEIDRLLNQITASIIKLQLHLKSNSQKQKPILDSAIQIKAIINSKAFDDESINNIRAHYNAIIENTKEIFKDEREKLTKTFRKKEER